MFSVPPPAPLCLAVLVPTATVASCLRLYSHGHVYIVVAVAPVVLLRVIFSLYISLLSCDCRHCLLDTSSIQQRYRPRAERGTMIVCWLSACPMAAVAAAPASVISSSVGSPSDTKLPLHTLVYLTDTGRTSDTTTAALPSILKHEKQKKNIREKMERKRRSRSDGKSGSRGCSRSGSKRKSVVPINDSIDYRTINSQTLSQAKWSESKWHFRGQKNAHRQHEQTESILTFDRY